MKKTIAVFFLLAIIFLTGSFVAIKSLSLGPDNSMFNTKYRLKVASSQFLRQVFGLHYDGDGRSDYLGNHYSKILIEVDTMAGLKVNPDVLTELAQKIQDVTGKETSFIISDTDIPYTETITAADVRNIVKTYRNVAVTADTASFYLVFLSTARDDDSLLGSTYQEYGIVLYQDALAGFTESSSSTFDNYELSTILHEFGHQLGLPHNDHESCLMTPEAETTHRPRFNARDVIVDFCDYEKELIKQNAAGVSEQKFVFPIAKAHAASPLEQKKVYLTFDADMTPGMKARLARGAVKAWYDPALVEYLTSNKIPATVFVTGMFAEVYPDLVKSLAANSNIIIGNHTYDHAAFTLHCYSLPALTSDAEKLTEIEKTQTILVNLTGKLPQWFRYPGLCHSEHDDNLVSKEGLQVSPGDLVSGDAFSRDPAGIVKHVLNQVKPGSAVVFHLGGPNAPATAEAIKLLVPLLKQQGYNFVALPSS